MPISKPKTNDWPPRMLLYAYDEDMNVITRSTDRKFDLNDNLFQVWHEDSRTVHLGFETRSANWPIWDDESLRWIEMLIRHDLQFDGNEVEISRHTTSIGRPCTEEFVWKVVIR